MHRTLAWMFPLLVALVLLADLALWAGVHNGPVGTLAMRSAQKEAPLALAYTHAGDALFGALGLQDWAVAFAGRRVGHAYPEVEAVPEAAMDILLRSLSWPMHAAHAGLPVLLLAWALWYWRRPRQLQTIRKR
jgi:hypothetical protein